MRGHYLLGQHQYWKQLWRYRRRIYLFLFTWLRWDWWLESFLWIWIYQAYLWWGGFFCRCYWFWWVLRVFLLGIENRRVSRDLTLVIYWFWNFGVDRLVNFWLVWTDWVLRFYRQAIIYRQGWIMVDLSFRRPVWLGIRYFPVKVLGWTSSKGCFPYF